MTAKSNPIRHIEATSAHEGLGPEEQAELLVTIDRIRQLSASFLMGCHAPDDAVRLIADLHHAVDSVYRSATSSSLKPACKTGCSPCCRHRVEVLDAEAILIAQEVQRRPLAEKEHLIKRLRHHVAVSKSGGFVNQIPPECAFLENSCCSIYSVRPATCRKAHSLSAEQCHARAKRLPQNFQVVVASEALMSGVSAAYREAGMSSASRELCASVLLALTDETVKTSWYAGISVFSV